MQSWFLHYPPCFLANFACPEGIKINEKSIENHIQIYNEIYNHKSCQNISKNLPKRPPKSSKMVGQEPRKSTSDQNIDLIDPPRRFLSSSWPQSVSKIASRGLPIDKNRYETTLGASIYRFLPIRSALSKTDFQPLSPPIFIIHVKSWFRIGIYGTNSPSLVFVSMSRVFCHLLIFKVKKVDFVCIFIDRSGPRFEHTSTMYRLTRWSSWHCVRKNHNYLVNPLRSRPLEHLRSSHKCWTY